MLKIFLARHAESKAQTREEFSIDSSLSKTGKRQAAKLGDFLRGTDFGKIYISPLKRARETFEHAGLPKEKAVFDSRLVEEMPGDSYTPLLPYPDADYGKPDSHGAWFRPSPERVGTFMTDLYTSSMPEDKILIISHGMLLSNIMCFFMGSKSKTFKNNYCFMHNAAVSLFFYDSRSEFSRLEAWNYTAHLEGLITDTVKEVAGFKI